MNALTEQYQFILNKLNLNVNNQTHTHTQQNCDFTQTDELSKLSFPLNTVEEIEFLECILTSNEKLKERMVSYTKGT